MFWGGCCTQVSKWAVRFYCANLHRENRLNPWSWEKIPKVLGITHVALFYFVRIKVFRCDFRPAAKIHNVTAELLALRQSVLERFRVLCPNGCESNEALAWRGTFQLPVFLPASGTPGRSPNAVLTGGVCAQSLSRVRLCSPTDWGMWSNSKQDKVWLQQCFFLPPHPSLMLLLFNLWASGSSDCFPDNSCLLKALARHLILY